METIRKRTFHQGTTVQRETVVIVGGEHRLQVRIEHGMTPNRCSAVVKRWSGDRWERVASIPTEHMSSWSAGWSPEHNEMNMFEHPFDIDESLLITTACRILGVEP